MLAPLAASATELRVALADFSGDNLDPIHGGPGRFPFHIPLFDFLLMVDQQRNIKPGLATRWTVSPDGLRYRFDLRKDVRFHDGTPLTAIDVRDHFSRLARGTGAHAGALLKLIRDIVPVDQHTVDFVLRAPSADFLGYLTPLDTTIGGITPSGYAARVGDQQFAAHPVGSGPWRLKSYRRGVYYQFEAVAHPFRGRPGYDTLRLLLVAEESTRIAMLRRGEVDIADVSIDGARQLRALKLPLLEIPDAFTAYISFIGSWERRAEVQGLPTRYANVKVRRALAMAINRPDILTYLLDGRGRLAPAFLMFPGDAGFDEPWVARAQVPFDPAGAKRLLAEAGYARGFRQRIYSVPLVGAAWFPKVLEVVASNWADIGIDVELLSMEWGALAPLVYGRPDSALGAAFGLRTGRTPFAAGKLISYVTAGSPSSIASVNWPGRAARLAAAQDPQSRSREFQGIVRDLGESYTLVPLFYMNALYGVREGVQGCAPIAGWASLALTWECMHPAASPGRAGTGPAPGLNRAPPK